MVVGLYLAILAGILCAVETQNLQCALLASQCALNVTNVMTSDLKNIDADEYICKTVDYFRKCMKGDGTLDCSDTAKTFQDNLKRGDIDVQTRCKNTDTNTGVSTGLNTGNNTGSHTSGSTRGTTRLFSLLNISMLFIQTIIAACII